MLRHDNPRHRYSGKDVTVLASAVLGLPPHIRPLWSITPSTYLALSKCTLRALWSRIGQANLLPNHPSAYLGRIIHRTIEELGTSEAPTWSDARFEEAWAIQEHRVESELKGGWMTQHLIPLHNVVIDYSLNKELCRQAVKTIQEAGIVEPKHGGAGAGGAFELDLRTSDGIISGRADMVRLGEEGLEIIDYKSGRAHLEGIWSKSNEALDEAAIQLKIYAALYFLDRDVWPDALGVMVGGKVIKIGFDARECLELIARARASLNRVNCIIRTNHYSRRRLISALAIPNPTTCRLCGFRPVCGPYWEARTRTPRLGWPHDVRGNIVQCSDWGTGRKCLTVIDDATGKEIQVTGITVPRHPALQCGATRIGLYSLEPYWTGASTFRESILTTIYRMDDLVEGDAIVA